MKIPAKRWHEAIQVRVSRRKYLADRAISADVLGAMEDFCREFRPFGDVAYGVVVSDSPENIFRGTVGSYGIITGAPAYIAFVGKEDAERVQEMVGYVGEGIILEATALGLNTCWVGGFFKPEVVARHVTLGRGERVFAVTPIGYSAESLSLVEKLMKGMATGRKRKALEVLVGDGVPEGEWSEWQRTAVLDGQAAPSAVNRQPWRFVVGADSVTVAVDESRETLKHLAKRLDCGIALLHAQVGAMAAGAQVMLEWRDGGEVGRLVRG